MIELDGVSVSFGELTVLEEITLDIDSGEFVGLIGPNGAGKTTLLSTINGVLDPDEGRVVIDGERVTAQSARELSRTVGTVPQDTHVGFAFRAEQIVEMGRTPHRSRLDWSDESDPVESALERTGTTHLRDRRIDELSGGERQRVLLARALAQEPAVLLLDEPTANLDINHQIDVLSLVEQLVADGRTALAAIHDLDLAARFCDRLCLLQDSSIRVQGSPREVLEDRRLTDAFDTAATVTENTVTGTPAITPHTTRPDRTARIHVVGRGEHGAAVFRRLWQAGFELSAGILPDGDRTARLADQHGRRTVTAPPFQQPDETTRQEAIECARSADLVVVAGHWTDGPVVEAVPENMQVHAVADTDTAAVLGDGGHEKAVSSGDELVATVDSKLRNTDRKID